MANRPRHGTRAIVRIARREVTRPERIAMCIATDPADPATLHRELAHFNVARLAVGVPSSGWRQALHTELSFHLLEGEYLEALRARVSPMVRACNWGADPFVDWFESLADTGPGQHHALFDWLAGHATLAQMRWFLTQEAAGEAGFDDLLACTQVKLPVQAKLECARNYWDELGHGKQGAMHGQLLEQMVRGLDLRPAIDTTVWESLALGNTMIGLAMTRRYAYQAIGALGVIELTAPERVRKVSTGMQRLGLDRRTRAYFDLHSVLDVSHARAWIREIIRPLVDADPTCARFIGEGALMRLVCGERCFDRYELELRRHPAGGSMPGPRPAGAEPMALRC